MTTPSAETKELKPADLANQLFDAAVFLNKNDPREAARQVIRFLTEALVYAITSTATDDVARKALLKSVGETVAAAPIPGKP